MTPYLAITLTYGCRLRVDLDGECAVLYVNGTVPVRLTVAEADRLADAMKMFVDEARDGLLQENARGDCRMSETHEKFRLAHNCLRNAQSKLALKGKGYADPNGNFSIRWDGLFDLSPSFKVDVCGEHVAVTSIESAIEFAAAAMERMVERISP